MEKLEMKNLIIINEQHTLLENQNEVIQSQLGDFELFQVPAQGWTLEEQKQIAQKLLKINANIVFASPVPVLLSLLCFNSGAGQQGLQDGFPIVGVNTNVYVLHNDSREKKELPNGKIIFTVANLSWQLVEIK